MKISETAIRRPIFATMVILALVVFGITSYRSIGVDLFPDVDFPVVTVTVPWEGADPETVETDVTDKIEEAVGTISGIKNLRSESLEGLCQVFIEFELEVDVDVASQDVRDKVSSVRGDLPPEIDPPVVEKFDLDSSPILAVVLSGESPIRELSEYADEVIKQRIEGIPGVGNVRLVGDREREIRIWLRSDQLRARGLTANDVIEAIQRENLDPPGGRVETLDREITVKTQGKVENSAEFGDLVIETRDGAPIRVRDVAYIEDGMGDFRSLARLNGQRAVSLLVRRQSGTNMVRVADAVKSQLDEIRADLPGKYQLSLASDLSVFVEQSISEAQGELLRGGVLAVLVILLFLRSFRGSFVAAVTIPTTIIATLTFVYAMGFTINMMTMLALTISVGMIIDDSIVVLENSYRHMEQGKPRREAALAGISEIGFAVIATSLAIGAVFVPVAFMKGLVGRFFYEFGMTVTFAVAISTFIAVFLSPMLCSRVLTVNRQHGRLFNFVERGFERIEGAYGHLLGWSLAHRWLVVLGAAGMFASSLAIAGLIGQEFVPDPDESQFNIQVQTPQGTSLAATSAVMAEIERRVADLPGVRETFTTIGSGVEQRVNVATLLVRMAPLGQRNISQFDAMRLARRRLADLSHLKLSVEVVPRVSGGGMRTAPVQYNVRGKDLDELAEVSEQIRSELESVPGIVDLVSTHDDGKPEARVDPDREKAAQLDVPVRDIGEAVGILIGGRKASTYEQGGKTYDVRVRLVENDRDRIEAIRRVPVRTGGGELIDLDNLVEIRRETGPVQIDRQDRTRQVTLMANLEKSKPLAAAMEDFAAAEKRVGLPAGVTSTFTGHAEMMGESFANIYFSLLLAVVLIYMVLAAQFESLVHPLTVMLSLPLSIVGALGLLAVTGRTLNIFSMIGMIMLMGLVTKNAILLIDYTNLMRSKGMDRDDAVLKAGPVRLRPILMTACSTIAGMIPVAIGLGSGAEQRAPMGTCIVGGMLTSTVLTLVVIPVIYTLFDDIAVTVGRLARGALGAAAGQQDRQSDPAMLPTPEPGARRDAPSPVGAGETA